MALHETLKTMSIALPLAGAALVPDEADACGAEPCLLADHWQSLEPINAAAIPIDGVLLLRGEQTGASPDADWLATVELTVTRDGQPIAGALETSAVDDVLVWRPAAPLEPGAIYDVFGALDNPDDDPYAYCAPDLLMLDFEFQADDTPVAPLQPPQVLAETSVTVTPHAGLADLVCCDGAMPVHGYNDCGGSGTYWDEGFCTPLRGLGTLQLKVTIDTGLPAPADAMAARRILVDGEALGHFFGEWLVIGSAEPPCIRVELTSLASGEAVMSEETCHGQDLVEQLGEQAIDPSPALAQFCAGAAYVCEVDPETGGWDPDRCTPWPGEAATTGDPTGGPTSGATDGSGTGEGTGSSGTDSGGSGTGTGRQDDLVDHGCACDGGGADPRGLLGLVGLGLLATRRRRGVHV